MRVCRFNRAIIAATALTFIRRSVVSSFRYFNAGVDYGESGQAANQTETIFSKILRKEIPADIVHEDEKCIGFRDVNPQAPTHILIIPRQHIPMLTQAQASDAELLGHLLLTANKIAAAEGLEQGFRLVINNGEHGAQSVYHLHVHLLGGRQLTWPPG